MKNVPQHIVLFPDGNRRWAKKHGLPTLKGHFRGKDNLRGFLTWCKNKGVKVITVFGFSTENWNRSRKEIDYLMNLFERYLSEDKEIFQENGVRVRIIGQKKRLPKSLQKVVTEIEGLTKNNKDFYLNLAVSYGGKWDILQAVQKIIKDRISTEKINEELFENYLSTAGLPVPDLVIRAGGEMRLSNFVIWQAAYSELYFSKKLWPEFTEKDLDRALEEYNLRQRRFGR
ncbi:MAG: di-trans,poly-cis-decaprenylcistransferase [Candidatus Staskawiczbacteria bacterium CG10_big_fil_rev_8_21_14_0_10_38_10]|uniref:Isoprenyl transferase n=1 Tax=Candidatus Staskawiczbacteria bacterium CG10_big_fil_rev_8_21_14_0_10_38_10 TaxID=1974891 RepID=A0A2H9T1L7_9BACT|nr:MAG: di-trans,poly-cis-decaprenylcistransferase [Candidatus Staskawiczbacteria bacterium CG10_big_fil_rev_8_21_14_0_10_38_10]